MKIHTNEITRPELFEHVPAGCWLEATEHGSRSRARAFDVSLSAEHGFDAHGLERVYARNTGQYGADQDTYSRAATYIEWGDWMVSLFLLDPVAKIGQYDNAEDFVRVTLDMAEHRPKRENAPEHAARWARELGEHGLGGTKARLEYLRGELRAERISWGELLELQGLADEIEPGDVELLEPAGVPESEAYKPAAERVS